MHPGWAETPGVAKSLPGFSKSYGNLFIGGYFLSSLPPIYWALFFSLIIYLSYCLIRLSGKLRTKEEGADTIIWLALQPKDKLVSGALYFDRAQAPKHLTFAATGGSHTRIDSIIGNLRSLSGLA